MAPDEGQRTAWAQWLAEAMRREGVTPAELAELSGGLFDVATVSRWLNGQGAASPEIAVFVSRVLHANVVEALRAAGHGEIADLVAESMRGANAGTLPSLPDLPAAEAQAQDTDLGRVLGAIQELLVYVDRRFTRLDAAVEQVAGRVEDNAVLADTAIAETRRDLAGVREEVLGVKVELAISERRQAAGLRRQLARHDQDPDAHDRPDDV